MGNEKRTEESSSKIPVKKVPPLSGKENARPGENRIAIRRKLSFAECEDSQQRSRIPLSAKIEGNGKTIETAANRTFLLTKTPFHVHCDERNAPIASEGAPGRQVSRQTRQIGDSSNVGQNEPPAGNPGEPRNCEKIQQSKIPLRSRCISVLPKVDATRIASLPENNKVPSIPASSAIKRTQISRALAPRTVTPGIRDVDLKCRMVGAARINRRVGRPPCWNVSTPVDGAPLPPVAQIPPKVALRAVDKSKTADSAREEAERKAVCSCPADSIYFAEYSEYATLVELEREERAPQLSSRFLTRHINAEQRRLVVAFLIRVGYHRRYSSAVVYQSVKLFDVAMDRFRVETMFIQLMALASLWISLKRQENFHKIPSATTMVNLAKELYAGLEDKLIAYERIVLCKLSFNASFADPYTLFAHHLISCGRRADATEIMISYLYHCGCYMIDVTMLDEQFCRTSARLVATTVAELVLGLVFDSVSRGPISPRWLFWRGLLFAAIPGLPGLPGLPDRFPDEEIDRTRVAILRRLRSTGKKHDAFETVYKKYARSRYGRVSESLAKRLVLLAAAEILFDP